MTKYPGLILQSIDSFINYLQNNNIQRFYFYYDTANKYVKSSHEALKEIADFLNSDLRDFDKHEGLFFELDSVQDVIHSAVVHRTNRGQAAGGVRFWNYINVEDFIRDGLRLAKGMTHKNALAGLWWGGGKGVIANNNFSNKTDQVKREEIYSNYGKFITSLKGCYVTAEDAGTNVSDMENVFSQTRFTTCIPQKMGGSGNPSVPTAKGIISGMEAALQFLGRGSLKNKVIAVQGLGNVSIPLIKFLIKKGVKKVIGCDIYEDQIKYARNEIRSEIFTSFKADNNDYRILHYNCDIISPCATGAILNSETIPHIKAKIVCGAANNQLEDPDRDDHLLNKLGILYVPDFLTNRMGIVNCANEQYGYIDNDPIIETHYDTKWEHSIHNAAIKVFSKSKGQNEPTGKVALTIAEELSFINHPIFGHRGEEIIKSLINSNWEKA